MSGIGSGLTVQRERLTLGAGLVYNEREILNRITELAYVVVHCR